MNAETTNPYVGLRPFEPDESILFFGRNDQTLELLQRLHKYHFVAVVGSSGCGKSSLLRAGLIPALKAGYLVDDSDQWFMAIMKPGQSPLYNLAEAIAKQVNANADAEEITSLFENIKEGGADVLLQLIKPLVKERSDNFFLLVDQFEELFRFSMDQKDPAKKDEAIDFVNIMLELAQQKELPVYVVITMRSDFIGDCSAFYGLPEAMNQSQYLVPRLNRVQLKTVIEGPAKLFGGKLNPSLTSLLLNELGKVKDELPLLQHALMRMWDYEINVNKSGELDLDDYKNIGGIERSLSNHADEALVGMSDEDLRITKEMFQALTAIDENGRKIRRPVLLSQLKELCSASEEKLLQIIQLFIKDSRCFLIVNNAGNSGDKIIDISHESLIRQWNTLGKWVDEEGESASVYLQISEAHKLHKQNKRDFLEGTELQVGLDWHKTFKPLPVWANRYREGFDETITYLQQSEEIRAKKEAERIEKERQEAERLKQEEEDKRQEKRKRNRRQIIISAIVLFSVLIFLIIFSVYTKRNQIAAEHAKQNAIAAEEKTKNLLQLVLDGRGKEYENKGYDAVVERLRVEQTYPIDSLIIPRAISVPVSGNKYYNFIIWIDVPSFRRDEIKEVLYTWPCKGFADTEHIGTEPSLGFAFGYMGWGTCPQILIDVKLTNGEIIHYNFPLIEYLENNN
jgi:hypothetical protein